MTARGISGALANCLIAATLAAPAARADVVTDWNETALKVTDLAGLPPPSQARVMALVHTAIYDAVNSVDRDHRPYLEISTTTPGARLESAAATAAQVMLAHLFPQQQAMLDLALKTSLGGVPNDTSSSNGAAAGREAADKLFMARQHDGSNVPIPYRGRTGPGAWQPTAPAKAQPALPHWGNVTPFVLTGARQFALAAPPSPDSVAFARDFSEVKRMGGWTTTDRTPEQTAIAIYWAGSEVPPWNAVARAAAADHRNSISDNARLFAVLNLAIADSLIVTFSYKYEYDTWRPITAIQAGDTVASLNLAADRSWRPLLITPPFPEYPSAHCATSGAAATVLRTFFGSDTVNASAIYPPLGIQRTWKTYTEIVLEVENARVWGGIHFRTADEQGTRLGEEIAGYVMKTSLQPVASQSR